MKRWLLLFCVLSIALMARGWNSEQIFLKSGTYFVDADCYSRMTRVAQVMEHPGLILRHHDFENWPLGTTPHTTAPLDYLIAGLAAIFRPFSPNFLDLAGAFTPVLLGIGATIILWRWVGQFRFLTQVAVLLTFAISPILVHGTLLGRPDHQALLIVLLIAAFVTEWELLKPSASRNLAICNGLASGLAVWTSLFEPVILLLVNVVLGIAIYQRAWFTRQRAVAAIAFGLILSVALMIEHWHVGNLPAGPLFDRWAASIGELSPVGWFSKTYLGWFGLGLLVVPFGLGWLAFRERNRASLQWGLLLLVTYILCTTAARWGYFMGIMVLFTLPLVLEKWRSRWLAILYFIGFWTIASEWDARLWPTQAEEERLAEQQEDYRQLRDICRDIHGGGIIAPWWLSPAIAYWTKANCVAGSSHQSLPGNEDTANFYLSRFPERSREILLRRNVTWVIAYEPSRVLATSTSLTGVPAAQDAFAVTLYDSPRQVPQFLELQRQTPFFKLYRFQAGD